MSLTWNSSRGSCSLSHLLISLLTFAFACPLALSSSLPFVLPYGTYHTFLKYRAYTENLHSEILMRPPGPHVQLFPWLTVLPFIPRSPHRVLA